MNYIYNGIELSAPPEWDTKSQPYLLLYQSITTGAYHLVGLPKIPTVFIGKYHTIDIDETLTYRKISIMTSSGWYKDEIIDAEQWYINLSEARWANFDICLPDGSVHLAASYPIDAETGEEVTKYGLYHPVPVSPVQLNPADVVQGYFVCMAVKRSR